MHLFSTLHSLDPKNVPKPPLSVALGGLALVSPVAAVGSLAAYEVLSHQTEVKSTLHSIGDEVKKDAPIVGSTLGKGVSKVGTIASSGYDHFIFPLLIVGILGFVMTRR